MKEVDFDQWLNKYSVIWLEKDTDAFGELFSSSASYHWTPFDEAKVGTVGIVSAFREAIAIQENIDFNYKILAWKNNIGLAHWTCNFNRNGNSVEIDGILQGLFNENDTCEEFREWWHDQCS